MKIVVSNIDRILRMELLKTCEIVGFEGGPDGAFVVWSAPDNFDAFSKQTKIVEFCLENQVPLIIFDKYQLMSDEEVAFLLKPNVFLWEPALSDRLFFQYQPVWGRILTDFKDIPNVDVDRTFDLCYANSLTKKIKQFEKYYKPVNDVGEYTVAYLDDEHYTNRPLCEKVGSMGVPIFNTYGGRYDLKDIKFTMLLGSNDQYRNGVLDPNLFRYLEAGVVPLLPVEHRWYGSLFNDLVISDPDQIEYFIATHKNIAFGLIYDVYCDLAEYLPEADVVNVAKRIQNIFK